jgi:general secretion pathway protein G
MLAILLLVSIGAAMALRGYASSHGGTEGTVARLQIRSLEMLLKAHKLTTGAYPTEEEGLAVIFAKRSGDTAERQQRVQEQLKDPWHRKIHYHIPGKHNPDSFDLYSAGPDGIEDTEDDIGNW